MRANSIALIALLAGLCLCSAAHAQKKGGGGKGGGGGSDPEPSGPLVVELSTDPGVVLDINELEGGSVAAVGGTYAPEWSAMCWTVSVDEAGTHVASHQLSRATPPDFVATHTRAEGINNFGVIVGYGWEVHDSPTSYWPLLWSNKSAEAFLLPVPAGWSGIATSVNDDGIVLGVVWDGRETPLLYSLIAWKVDMLREDPVEDSIAFLPSLGGGALWDSVRPKISQSGLGVTSVVSGVGNDWESDAYRFRLQYEGGVLRVLETQPAFDDPLFNTKANGVNDQGAVAGAILGLGWEAYVLDGIGELVTLETLPDERFKGQLVEYRAYDAEAINNLGISVGRIEGWYLRNDGTYGIHRRESAMWNADGALTLLPNWYWSSDINDAGWIAGVATPNGPPCVLVP